MGVYSRCSVFTMGPRGGCSDSLEGLALWPLASSSSSLGLHFYLHKESNNEHLLSAKGFTLLALCRLLLTYKAQLTVHILHRRRLQLGEVA